MPAPTILPSLHRVRAHDRVLWWLGDYPLFLARAAGGWQVDALPSDRPVRAWLEQHGVRQQRYPSRQAALTVLEALLALDGAPRERRPPAARPHPRGGWQVQGGYRLWRTAAGWQVDGPNGYRQRAVATHWLALWFIDAHARRASD